MITDQPSPRGSPILTPPPLPKEEAPQPRTAIVFFADEIKALEPEHLQFLRKAREQASDDDTKQANREVRLVVGVPFGSSKELIRALECVDETFRYDKASWLPKNGYVRAHNADLVVLGSDQESEAFQIEAQTVVLAEPSAPPVPFAVRSSTVSAIRAGVLLSGLEVVNPVYVLIAALLWDIVLTSAHNPRALVESAGNRTVRLCFGASAVAVKCVFLGPLQALWFLALLVYEAYRGSPLTVSCSEIIPTAQKENESWQRVRGLA